MRHGHAEPGRHLGDCRANTCAGTLDKLRCVLPYRAAVLPGYQWHVRYFPTQRSVFERVGVNRTTQCIDPGRLNSEADPGGE